MHFSLIHAISDTDSQARKERYSKVLHCKDYAFSLVTVNKDRLVQNGKEKKLGTSEWLDQNLWIHAHFYSEI